MPSGRNSYDERLFGYLLATLPAEEMERLDERSIADDDFAMQLRDAENDLVDAYVHRQLSSNLADRFRVVYLGPGAPASRRQKVRFAQSLLAFQQRSEATATAISLTDGKARPAAKGWRLFSWPAWQPQWGMALAALVLLAATGYLSMANHLLRQRAERAEADQASLRQKLLQNESASNSSATANDNRKSERNPLDGLKIAAFVLAPISRGGGTLPSMDLPPGTDLVVLNLRLEATEFREYRAALLDPATQGLLWRSAELKSQAGDRGATLPCAIRADLLNSQTYLLQVYGLRSDGSEEALSSYSFRVKSISRPGPH